LQHSNQKPMKHLILCGLLCWGAFLTAQTVNSTVLSALGQSGANDLFSMSGTLGEAFIFSGSDDYYWGQGFQTNHFFSTTSVASLSPKHFELRIYPNPSSELFFIEAGHPVRSLEVYAITGQMVWSAREYAPVKGIDIRAWPAGLYAVRADFGQGRLGLARLVVVRP
jgi:hypothetical protein